MKNAGSLLIVFFTCCLTVSGQLQKAQIDPSKISSPSQHYLNEFIFDSSSDPARWNTGNNGLKVSFGSTDQLYLRSEVPEIKQGGLEWVATGWKGERLNAQILVWSADTLNQIRVRISDLANEKGSTIKKENVKLNMVRYVLSNYPYGANNTRCDDGASDTAYLMPDRLEGFERFDLPGKTVRPIWLTINIPQQAQPGNYSGTMEVISDKEKISLKVKIKVQNQLLPPPHDWKFRLDLWQNPWVVAQYYQVKPWSQEHRILLKKHLQLYADTGGKYITTYAVHSPWSDNSFMLEGSMIDWKKSKEGSWKFDYTIFDDYVGIAMETGIDEAITIYTPVPWGHRFRYLDEQSGNYLYEEWSPETAKFKEVWNVFLSDLKSHLEKKGWFKKTYLGINENPLDITIAAAKVIKDHSKDWRITYAGDWHAELSPLLDDYSPVISSEPTQQQLGARRSLGQTTTYYVCCTPPRPNNFVFSPPVESRYIGWYSAAYGYDGFLRWAYDAWPEDPMRDARHTLWPAGDCFLVYPGGNSSIRFEKLREGIVDFEKIRILREGATLSSDKKIKNAILALDNHLKLFIDNPDYSKRSYTTEKISALLSKGKLMIEQLSNDLNP